jgi:5-oxoprolinase (ATP-hydrolysing)
VYKFFDSFQCSDKEWQAIIQLLCFFCLQLDVNTVAAGGGSMLFFRSGLFVVGPESAGAHPGPVCYRKGGPLTVTDANLCLGRLLPEYFPKIFGPSEKEPLDKAATTEAFCKLTEEVWLLS